MTCVLYEKHHNIIDGIYTERKPLTWEDIPYMNEVDAEDESGELFALFQDIKIYDIEDLVGFENPKDPHNIEETIFIIRRNGEYYLVETQGENYVKFAVNVTNVEFVNMFDRMSKLMKLYNQKTFDQPIKPLF
jgi:hypothetical protein